MLGGYVGLVDSHLSVPQEMPAAPIFLSFFSIYLNSKTKRICIFFSFFPTPLPL